MALVRKKVKGKEYLYEVSYVREGGKLKQKWKLIGKVTNSISNSSPDAESLLSRRLRVQIPPSPPFCFQNELLFLRVTNTVCSVASFIYALISERTT